MLDNWTTNQFFDKIEAIGFARFAHIHGRISITDNAHLEKTYDQFAMAFLELQNQLLKWGEKQV